LPERDFQASASEYERSLHTLEALLGILIDRQIVVAYYTQTSEPSALLQAALIPWLREENFAVLPPVDTTRPTALTGYNRYLLSTMLSLEADMPPTERLPLAWLAPLSLSDYLAQRAVRWERLKGSSSEQEEVLIFPAFEQLLITDPADLNAKYAFFAQLGMALRYRQCRALFVLPRAHIAGLAPYRRLVPTCYRYTFCLDTPAC
jgi:hypothetical protein